MEKPKKAESKRNRMPREQSNDLSRKAQEVLQFLKTQLRYDFNAIPRPFFIEITGSPSAGKTTTITELDKFLRRQGFRVLRPQEGAEVIRHISRKTPLYNLRTCLYALTILIDEANAHNYDVVIFDRCIFDAYSWMMYWREHEKITDEEQAIFQTFAISRFWADYIDLAYFMIADPEVAGERELRIALSKTLGETTSPASVKLLIERYRKAHGVLAPTHPQLRLLDTTTIPESEMVEIVASEVLETLERKAMAAS